MNNEDFLSRWSRRKRAVEEGASEPLPPALVPSRPQEGEGGSAVASEVEPADELDLSALPPLDSITSETDVATFLRKGVPQELTREALRRAWLADPAIRDFVGLAENAWDFNDPNVMPGFGLLDYTPEQVRDLVARIITERKPAAGDDADSAAPQLQQNVIGPTDPSLESSAEREMVAHAPEVTIGQVESDKEAARTDIATPRNSSTVADGEQASHFPVTRRTHGSALPQ